MFTTQSDLRMCKNVIMPISGTYLKLELVLLSELSKNPKGKNYTISLTGAIYTRTTMNYLIKQRQSNRLEYQTYGYHRGKKQGRYKLGAWDEQIQSITCERDKKQYLLREV